MSCYRGQFGRVWLGAVGVLLLSATTTTAAQDGKAPWEEYDKLISANKAVTTLGPQMFGDSVDLISGALTFATTDVSITGNNALPVAVTRTFRVISDKEAATYAFGDWDIDIPNISGLFAPTWHNNRCDQAVPPSVVVSGQTTADSVAGTRYWKGNTVNMPGGGDLMLMDASSPHPSTGGPYTWITPGRTVFSCLATIKNGSGQGFLAITTDGTQYWFDYLAQYEAASYEDTYQVNNTDNPGDTNPPAKYETATVTRKKNALYATRVQDRFGNWVTYTYTNAYNQPLKVSAIAASDGRNITFHYNGNLIDSVSTGSGTWTYQYSGPFLTGVVQPDSGRWAIAFSAFSNADIQYAGTSDPNGRTCFRLGSLDTLYSGPYTGTITHPSGAVGTFTVAPTIHSRTNVPAICENYVAQSVDPAVNDYNDPTNDYAIFPIKWHAMSLISKTITGPGLPTQAWSFNYASGASWYYPDGGTEPICKTTTCADPVCLSDDCAGVATTTMIGPNAEWTRHTFGNSYRYNEGKLLKIEEGLDQDHILRTTTKSYDLAQSGQPYPAQMGTSQQPFGDGFVAEFPRPEVASVISQQDVTFSRSVDIGCVSSTAYCLDTFLRPTRLKRASSLGYSKLDTTTYYDQLASWVLGQVATESTNGIETARTDYDATTALPLKTYDFGLLQQTFTYNADGTLATVKDGRDNLTTVSSWYRGVPRLIIYPNTQTESATVNPMGRLLTTTDELGSINSYGYDAMDRLNSITYPAGDTTAWNATSLPFVAVTVAEYGIPAGHWTQTVQTGNGKSTTFYDAQWRPVLVLTEDTANAASKSFVVKRYDANGRLVFASYPVASLSTVNDTLLGSTTVYDAIGRVTQVKQDSEL